MRLCMCMRILRLRLCWRRSGHQRRWSETMSVLKRIFRPPKIPPGSVTYRGKGNLAGLALQLRVEPNGDSVMVINADRVLFLNESATAYAYYFMHGFSSEDIVKKIRRTYRINLKKAREDY